MGVALLVGTIDLPIHDAAGHRYGTVTMPVHAQRGTGAEVVATAGEPAFVFDVAEHADCPGDQITELFLEPAGDSIGTLTHCAACTPARAPGA